MRIVCGVGINDADYKVQINSNINKKAVCLWKCPYYTKWKSMLERCYSIKVKTKHQSYKDCYVCEEWLLFSNFKSWMEKQDWEDKSLDKDLLIYNNKVYSPETCIFLPKEMNCFLIQNKSMRAKYPMGVHKLEDGYRKKPFMSMISIKDTKILLGYFDTPQEAHKEWQKAKLERATYFMDISKGRIQQGFKRVVDKIQNDLNNNLITEDF